MINFSDNDTPNETESNSWAPFEIENRESAIGFAISSPLLYLKEGERYIYVIMEFSENIGSSLNKNDFEAYITTEKEWTEVNISYLIVFENYIYFILTIPADKPSFISFNKEVHLESFNTNHPVLKIINDKAVLVYENIHHKVLEKIDLYVSANGLRNIILQNDLSNLDPAKPFLPFGPAPEEGGSLIIGDNEIFQKPLNSLWMDLTWEGLPTDSLEDYYDTYDNISEPFNIDIKGLKDGEWKETISEDEELFNASDWDGSTSSFDKGKNRIYINDPDLLPFNLKEFAYNENTPYEIKDKSGYIKLVLNQPLFGHKTYPQDYTEAMINFASNKHLDPEQQCDVTFPSEPYTPKLGALSMGYVAREEIFLNDVTIISAGQFFHIQPSGINEAHPSLNPENTDVYILPQFPYKGELFIGFENTKAQQHLSVLFQLEEGTAPTIEWHYLEKNNWKSFPKDSVIDNTKNLIQSGIITYKLPSQIDKNNNLLPAGYFWIRAAVKENTDAVNRIIAILAQAVKVELVMNGDKDKIIRDQLPAGTIAKPLERSAAIKSINQPFSTFGGRPTPDPDTFFTTVSELLRHKNRAIMIFDYERIVLENFNEIFKVKCLNHTRINSKDYELSPGHVTIITIPKLINQTNIDVINKPYTSKAILEEIDAFLRKKISPFVKLKVTNPKFERIQVEFKRKTIFTFVANNYPGTGNYCPVDCKQNDQCT